MAAESVNAVYDRPIFGIDDRKRPPNNIETSITAGIRKEEFLTSQTELPSQHSLPTATVPAQT
jgi:hypothetical protein